MNEEYITRVEHEEFTKRMQDEHIRLSKRISEIKEVTQQINDLAMSVQRLATNMENMLENQKEQEKRIDEMESRDGKMWRQAIGYVLTAIIGIVVGFVFKQIGM